MEPVFAHPIWISTGVLLIFAGIMLVRWAARDKSRGHIAAATHRSTVRKLFGAPPRDRSAERADARSMSGHRFRGAMAQFFGIVGFLLIIAGLMAALLGIFYVGP